MSRHLPFRVIGQCIDCAAAIPPSRDDATWRCDACHDALRVHRNRITRLLQIAIKSGELVQASNYGCADCGEPAYDYDHRDYRKPLDVVPVCRTCNQRRGPAAWRDEQPAQTV